MFQAPPVSTYGDYSSYMQAVTQYYSQPATANQAYATKVHTHVHTHANTRGPSPNPQTAVSINKNTKAKMSSHFNGRLTLKSKMHKFPLNFRVIYAPYIDILKSQDKCFFYRNHEQVAEDNRPG